MPGVLTQGKASVSTSTDHAHCIGHSVKKQESLTRFLKQLIGTKDVPTVTF